MTRVKVLTTSAIASLVLAACAFIPPSGCPIALLSGRLAPSDDGGALVGSQRVIWPDGYTVEQTPDVVLRDQWGQIVAVEGETIYVGGGEDPNDPHAFRACGYVSRDPP
jgi:hypothetical protein